MIKHLIYSLICIVFTIASCNTKKGGQTSSQNSCKVVVSFASRGTGINYSQYEKLTGLLNDKKLKFTEKVMGREGEKDICIPLTELKNKEKTELIEQLKTFRDEATLISVSVN